MSWIGEAEAVSFGLPHKDICPMLNKMRKVAKGKATMESTGLREDMLAFLKAVLATPPQGSAQPSLCSGRRARASKSGIL